MVDWQVPAAPNSWGQRLESDSDCSCLLRTPASGGGRRGFSFVELLIVIAVITILIALLLPVVSASRAKSRQAKCARNLTQIRDAFTLAKPKVPAPFPSAHWPDKLRTYLDQETGVYNCPDNTDFSQPSYGMNSRAWRLETEDTGRILLLDLNAVEAAIVAVGKTKGDLDISWPNDRAPRHFQQQNVVFGDGHIEPKSPDGIDPRFCEYYDQYWRPKHDWAIKLNNCLALGSSPAPSTGGSGTATTGTTAAAASSGSPTTTTTGGTTATTTSTSTTTRGTTTGPQYCNGLRGEYRGDSRSFTDMPTNPNDYVVRVDTTFNAPFGMGIGSTVTGNYPFPHNRTNQDRPDPANSVFECEFTARWTGEIRAGFAETYHFTGNVDDNVKIWINNALVVSTPFDGPTTFHADVVMEKDQWVPIVIEYMNNAWANDYLSIQWSSPSMPGRYLAAPFLRTPGPCP